MFLLKVHAEGWVTIKGAKVFIDDNGKVTKGPAKFMGSTLDSLSGNKTPPLKTIGVINVPKMYVPRLPEVTLKQMRSDIKKEMQKATKESHIKKYEKELKLVEDVLAKRKESRKK